MCETDCQAGVVCDFECMTRLAPGDVGSTAEYLVCKRELIEEFSPEKLCQCGAICGVTYPTCE